ncbi:methyltransferase domain-containing protein [Chlorogloea sp. CCALA 695]|uniref:methyltransferase domain-containing protein n=1 Tax=Chlorogloea sp. CCALA 695 TaxID=2107693 RepID=UPI000D048B7B|nr:methyltransferase domain-containing protein [Chlorogloea sp. CCALA 695]PSB32742.1 methylase [Chlorogloea sp. CCALA 695]
MYHQLYTQGKYLDNNPTWDVEDSPWKAQEIFKMIEKNDLKITSISEVGCGAGEILNQLYTKMPENVQFSGYEISPQAGKLCRDREKDRLNFYLTDITKDENAFYDLILCIDVVEHIEECFSFLRQISTKSRYQIFHIPLDLSVSSILRVSPILSAREKVGHIHYFSKETALAILKDTGYEIVDWFYTAGAIELAAKSFKTRLAKVPRQLMYALNPNLAVRLMGGYSLMVLTKS